MQFVDIHCHCLPGLDDGPETTAEAVALCRALVLDGITGVIATPHQLGRYEGRNAAADIRESVAALNRQLRRLAVPLTVAPGADVRVDERLIQMLDDDTVLTLADQRQYILLELPHDTFIDVSGLLEMLLSGGMRGIISHPERNAFIARNPDVVRPWLQRQALLQITAGSLAGDFGPLAQKAGWCFLQWGGATVIATDAHNLWQRRPRMGSAYGLIRNHLGPAAANRMCLDVPARIMAGADIASAAGGRLQEESG